jgi:predicted nucleic acid-binding protein
MPNTYIRAHYGFKTPDAIHLAAAVVAGCEVFLTNDHRLDRFSDLTVEIVQP